MTITAPLPQDRPRPRRWTVEEFFRAASLGLFGSDERLELIQGEIREKMPTDPPHSAAVELARAALVLAFAGQDCTLKSENPLVLSTNDAPEPDVLVLRGSVRDYIRRHPMPADVLLLVEIADTTLLADRREKAGLYARAGIAEFWIVNLRDRCVEVHRDAGNGEWAAVFTVPETGTVSPLGVPAAAIAVADLLP